MDDRPTTRELIADATAHLRPELAAATSALAGFAAGAIVAGWLGEAPAGEDAEWMAESFGALVHAAAAVAYVLAGMVAYLWTVCVAVPLHLYFVGRKRVSLDFYLGLGILTAGLSWTVIGRFTDIAGIPGHAAVIGISGVVGGLIFWLMVRSPNING